MAGTINCSVHQYCYSKTLFGSCSYIGISHHNTNEVSVLLCNITAIQMTLLLLSGDIELNPGPGLYPGELHVLNLCY